MLIVSPFSIKTKKCVLLDHPKYLLVKRNTFVLYILLLLSVDIIFAQEEKTLAVGRTASELAVSATGAATYLVPLVLPPGIKEVMPSLALSYNSQGGNGIAGWGWNLAGLYTISRIGATQLHEVMY